MSRLVLVIIFSVFFITFVNGKRLIKTKLGSIFGTEVETLLGNNNTKFCAYRGIPYAKAPVGKLRFRAPVAVDPWRGTYEALNYGPACIQQSNFSGKKKNLTYSEDCLSLNIFVPNQLVCDCKPKLLPVLVYVYGGSFTEGDSTDYNYGPQLQMNRCVIVVVLNYRVGAFGFLSMRLKNFSGNMGLKDQKLAIAFIRKNICAFGGNPKRITIYGESVGGTSVLYQGLNKESAENFQQIYSMSGSPLIYYSQMVNDHTDIVLDLASRANVTVRDTEGLVDFIQSVSADLIVQYTSQTQPFGLTKESKWAPIIERIDDDEAFIWRDPLEIYKTEVNTKPIVMTQMTMEFIPFILSYIANPSTIEFLNDNFTLFLPYRHLDQTACATELRVVFDAMRDFYFGDDSIGNNTIRQFVRMYSDMYYGHSIQRTIALLAKHSAAPIRYMIVNPRTPINSYGSSPGVAALGGSGHGEDVPYIFYPTSRPDIYTEWEEKRSVMQTFMEADQVSNVMIDFLTTFAIDGAPTSETGSFNNYPIVDRRNADEDQPFVEISNTGIPVEGKNYNWNAYKLWTWIDEQLKRINKLPCNRLYSGGLI